MNHPAAPPPHRPGIKIRTAVFGVYVAASALGFAVLMGFVLQDVRSRYLEAMRRTMGDTAAFLATFAGQGPAGETWTQRLAALPPDTKLLRVFAEDPAGLVLFDSAAGRDVGRTHTWPMTGGGRAASEDYTLNNVALVDDELRVRAPVRQGDVVVGWVGVGRPVDSVAEGVSHARLRLMGIALGIAAVMTAAGWWLAHKLTHSLERLTAYAQAVRDGQPAAPPASRAREIAALGQAFEEMRVALEGKKYVERYTQTLTHELKAPLSVIRGAAELLQENMGPEDRVRFLAHLRAESERIQQIVDRMLQLAALEARRGLDAAEPVGLGEVVREAAEALRPLWAVRRLEVHVAAPDGPQARGERFLLVQAVTNLLQNALEFTPEGGMIEMRLETAVGEARIVIEDTGPGVPDYAVERIFERFYSLARPDTGRKSTGLGLSFVREIAVLHGGEAGVANRPEGGARATLRLPLL
jgi:two-component system sensor histidine kinase CreC